MARASPATRAGTAHQLRWVSDVVEAFCATYPRERASLDIAEAALQGLYMTTAEGKRTPRPLVALDFPTAMFILRRITEIPVGVLAVGRDRQCVLATRQHCTSNSCTSHVTESHWRIPGSNIQQNGVNKVVEQPCTANRQRRQLQCRDIAPLSIRGHDILEPAQRPPL